MISFYLAYFILSLSQVLLFLSLRFIILGKLRFSMNQRLLRRQSL